MPLKKTELLFYSGIRSFGISFPFKTPNQPVNTFAIAWLFASGELALVRATKKA
jgi:hypothetical protein